MSAIGKGDWLLAVKSWPQSDFVVAGQVYVVSGLTPPAACDVCRVCGDAGPGLLLVDDPDDWGAWCACFFRPLKPPGEEVKTAEAPTPELEAA